jgi:hypothetical protein
MKEREPKRGPGLGFAVRTGKGGPIHPRHESEKNVKFRFFPLAFPKLNAKL